MTDARALYGTDAPIAPSERVIVGKLSFTLENGALRHIRVGEAEILRGISFLVRDKDWGTLVPRLDLLDRQVSEQRAMITIRAVYEHNAARLNVQLKIAAETNRLLVSAIGVAEGDFETNRAGFTLLHPAGLAGQPVRIGHSDGKISETEFPRLIDPWQPFMDIAEMAHSDNGLEVTCTLLGDTFETEDQRQWGDASYKTYNRPLAKPWPYVLEDGSNLDQSVKVCWRTCRTVPAKWKTSQVEDEDPVRFPETAILVNAVDVDRAIAAPSDIRDVAPQRLLCSIDETLGDVTGQCRAFAALQRHFPELTLDLEAVCTFEQRPQAALGRLRKKMDAVGFLPASILVCPSVDRQSTPPGSEWPACPPLEEIHDASNAVFADLKRGGGMVTFFPELNRKRPPPEKLDFVSHALCPIVHAADDVSVMETLEAIPHITASARAFIGKTQYRIGPCTIAMRHNPYGKRTMPNPSRDRVCMANDDPRHTAAFGAAYAIGLACALASSGITVWTPSELYGPRGLFGPLRDVVTMLARFSQQAVKEASVQNGLGRLRVETSDLLVNLAPENRNDLPAFGWRQNTD